MQNPCCKLSSLAACVPEPNTEWLNNLDSDSQEQTVERPERGKKGRKNSSRTVGTELVAA